MKPIDGDKIVKYLEENASKPPVGQPSLLVRFSLYEGLANRIRSGEFNIDAEGGK